MRGVGYLKSAGVVVGSVAAVCGLRAVLDGFLLDRLPYLLFVLAVTVSTFVGGYRAGASALLLSLLAGTYLFASPSHTWSELGPDQAIAAFTFVFVSTAIMALLLTERRRRRELSRTSKLVQEQLERNALLERELDSARRLESLGRLAGGVAHDFNNLLTVILGTTELLQSSEPLNQDLGAIRSAAERGAELTRQLLCFARREPIQLTVLSPNVCVDNALELTRRLLPEDILVDVCLTESPWLFQGSAALVQQVLVNLIVNARDAMPAGGLLRIETANVTLDERFAKRNPEVTPGEYVRIHVADTGEGMEDEVARRVFEPFFTTKARGKGTGLGLAVSYGFIKQLGGHISVRTTPKQGTAFDVFLPRSSAALPLLAVEAPVVHDNPSGLHVLLVEDDTMVRNIASAMLRSKGHTVQSAESPARALQLAREHPGPIDVLVTDVVMPWMNGRELADAITKLRPNIPVVYMSGYTENIILRRGVIKPGVQLVRKPFTAEQLDSALREVCASARAAG